MQLINVKKLYSLLLFSGKHSVELALYIPTCSVFNQDVSYV